MSENINIFKHICRKWLFSHFCRRGHCWHCRNMSIFCRKWLFSHFCPSWHWLWEAEYGGSIENRTAARKAMFDAVGSQQGAARGWIGAAEFTD